MTSKTVLAAIAAIVCICGNCRDMPIQNGRLVNALNANHNMITNLPPEFWYGHTGGGADTNAVRSLIDESFVGGTNAVNDALGSYATEQEAGVVATNTVDEKVATWAMKGQPQPGGGGADTNAVNDLIREYDTTNLTSRIAIRTTTNDVNAIIASSNLCTVDAAQAMTNGIATWASGKFLEINGTGEAEGLSVSWNMSYNGLHFNCGGTFDGVVYFGASSGVYLYDFSQIGYFSEGHCVELPDYLKSGEWNTASDRFAKKSDIASTSVTNGGAKAYADAEFRKKTDNVCHEDTFAEWEGAPAGYGVHRSVNYPGIGWALYDLNYPERDDSTVQQDESFTKTEITFDEGSWPGGYAFTVTRKKTSSYGQPFVTADNVPSTNGFVTASITNGLATRLSGRVYDFANGMNFTKNLYTALTNVIQTLGGTVANPPTFN